ncbi:PAS domain S-box-containing protein [Microvirga guangxiensis]|uniref:histidine kinase n=2 Tax=Microvirga guangxiensis TaxID=549386 RepID=A0A1G5IY91_9HYPH|nr:PAS domain S-box-containing protein [Microvirga guangxiensis]
MFEAFPSDPESDSHKQLSASFERVIREKATDHLPLIEYAIALPDNQGFETRFWSATHTPMFDESGEVIAILQHTVDVTELHQLRNFAKTSAMLSGPSALIETDMFRRAQAVQEVNQALTKERQHLQDLFEQAPGFIAAVSGPDHVFTMANAAYRNLVDRTDLLGKPVIEALPEIVGQGFVDLLDRVYRSGEPFVGRGVRIFLNQSSGEAAEEHFLDFVYQPIFNREGAVSGIFVQGHDVTDHRRAEEAVRESEQRFRLVAESAPVMLWMGDLQGKCVYLNRAQREFWGLDEAAVAGFEWGDMLHPDDQTALFAPFSQGMRDHAPFTTEARFKRADGEYRIVQTNAQPRFDSSGAFLGMIGVNVDITETRRAENALRDSEERFRAIANSIDQLIWATRPDGFHDYYNQRWYEYTGVPEGSTDGASWNGMFHPEDQEHAWKVWRHSLETGEPYHIEYRLRHRSGQYRWVLGRAQPVFNEEGQITRWYGTCTDIHDFKQAQEELRASREKAIQSEEETRRLAAMLAERVSELDAANEEIQRFAYIVSHDLRAPLVNIMGFTSELENAQGEIESFYKTVSETKPELVVKSAGEAIESDLPEAIGFIRSSTVKMDKLINAILRLSREGRRVLTPEPVHMSQLLEAQHHSLTHQLHERGAELVIEKVPDLVSDRLAIEQIFGNLMDNAVKYLEPGRPGRIVVRGHDNGLSVRYEIEDNGRGIDEKDYERIFDLFRRSGTQDQQGEGIGLAHVRALVRRLGGAISVKSRLGEGTTFTVTLPKYISMSSEAA